MKTIMIPTLKPYGSINKSTIKCLEKLPHDQFVIVDNDSNKWFIDEFTFVNLTREFPVKN